MTMTGEDLGAQGLAARSPHAAEAPARLRCLDFAARCRWRVNVLAAALMFLGFTRAPTAGGIQPLFGGSLTWRVDRHFNNASGEGRRVTLTLWTAFAASQACVYETGRAPRCGDSPECGTACSVVQRFVALSGRVKLGTCTYWSQTGTGPNTTAATIPRAACTVNNVHTRIAVLVPPNAQSLGPNCVSCIVGAVLKKTFRVHNLTLAIPGPLNLPIVKDDLPHWIELDHAVPVEVKGFEFKCWVRGKKLPSQPIKWPPLESAPPPHLAR